MVGRRVLGDPPAGDPVRARLLGPRRHRHRAGRTGGPPLSAAALLPPAAVGLVVLLGVRALRRAPRPGEGLLAAEAFLRTATREEPSAAVLSPDGLGALHVAVYAAVTRAFDRADTLVAVGRELLLVAAITSAVLLWGIARRLGFGRASAAGAILLAGVPALLSSAALLDVPAALAVPWLLLAAWLTAPGRPAVPELVAAALSTAVAVLLAPVVLVLLLTGAAAALATGVLLRRATPGTRGIAAVLLVGAAVVIAVLLPAPTRGVESLGSGTLATAALAFVVIGGLTAWTSERLRVPALALVATTLVALLPSGRLSTLVICLPVAAVLGAGLVRALVSRSPEAPQRVLRIAGAAALAAAVVASVVVLLRAPASATAGRNPAGALVSWVESGLSPETRLVAESPLRAHLIHAGADPDQVFPPGTPRPDEPGAPLLDVVQGDAPDDAVVLARFAGAGSAGPLLVVDPAPGTPTPEELGRRRSLAAALLDNPTTTTGDRAADVLRSGEIDPRLLALLAALGAQFGVGVQDFPLADGEPGEGPLPRRALIDRIAGDPTLPGAPATERLLAWLDAQLPPFHPDSVVPTDQGVRIEFAYVSGADALVSASAP